MGDSFTETDVIIFDDHSPPFGVEGAPLNALFGCSKSSQIPMPNPYAVY